MRTFTNKLGVTYDPLKTSVIFAEDMNELAGFITNFITHDVDVTDRKSVAATPSVPFFEFTLAPGAFSAVGISLVCDIDLGFETFDTTTSFSVSFTNSGYSSSFLNVTGQSGFTSGGPALLRMRFTRINSNTVRAVAEFYFNDQYFRIFQGFFTLIDLSLAQVIKFYANSPSDDDVHILMSSFIYEK